jgi:hypothetical protein
MFFDANQQVPFQPTNAIFIGVDVLLSVRISLLSMMSLVISIYVRPLLMSVQAMMRLLTSLNASQIS